MLTSLLSVVLTVFIISFLVFIHELGHFLAARAVGVKVTEFSIGFGPKLYTWQGKETQYSLRWLLLGGYVQMLGDTDPSSMKPDLSTMNDPRSYLAKPPWARVIITVAGVFVNFVFGAIAFMFVLSASANSVSLRQFGNYNFIGGDRIDLQVILTQDFRGEDSSYGIIKSINGETFTTIDELQSFLIDTNSEIVNVELLTQDGLVREDLVLNGPGISSNLDLDFFTIDNDSDGGEQDQSQDQDLVDQGVSTTRLVITGVSQGASFAEGQIGDRTFEYESGSTNVNENLEQIEGQYILAINDEQILSSNDLNNLLTDNLGQSIVIDLLSSTGETTRISVNLPTSDEVENNSILGISYVGISPGVIPDVVTIIYPNPFVGGIMHAINVAGYNGYTLAYFIGEAFTGNATLLAENTGSVIRVGEEINTTISQEGLGLGLQVLSLVNMAAFISVILAFMNILPLPILDGGNLVLILIEWITGKKIPENILNKVFMVFFIIFIILTILLVGWDTFRLFFD